MRDVRMYSSTSASTMVQTSLALHSTPASVKSHTAAGHHPYSEATDSQPKMNATKQRSAMGPYMSSFVWYAFAAWKQRAGSDEKLRARGRLHAQLRFKRRESVIWKLAEIDILALGKLHIAAVCPVSIFTSCFVGSALRIPIFSVSSFFFGVVMDLAVL